MSVAESRWYAYCFRGAENNELQVVHSWSGNTMALPISKRFDACLIPPCSLLGLFHSLGFPFFNVLFDDHIILEPVAGRPFLHSANVHISNSTLDVSSSRIRILSFDSPVLHNPHTLSSASPSSLPDMARIPSSIPPLHRLQATTIIRLCSGRRR